MHHKVSYKWSIWLFFKPLEAIKSFVWQSDQFYVVRHLIYLPLFYEILTRRVKSQWDERLSPIYELHQLNHWKNPMICSLVNYWDFFMWMQVHLSHKAIARWSFHGAFVSFLQLESSNSCNCMEERNWYY